MCYIARAITAVESHLGDVFADVLEGVSVGAVRVLQVVEDVNSNGRAQLGVH